MIVWLAACQAAAFCFAFALLRRCDSGARNAAMDICLHGALAVGLSLSATSCLYFVALRLGLAPGRGYCLGEAIGLACLAPLLWLLPRRVIPYAAQSDYKAKHMPGEVPSATAARYARLLPAVFALSFLFATAGILGMFAVEPDGGWDAWNIWTLRARYLFRSGADWQKAFAPIFPHTDYPLMLSASIARSWNCLGEEPLWVPQAIAMAFTLAAVVLLAAGVARLRGKEQGWLAGLGLLASVAYLQHGASLYADVPLSFFFLAALLLLAIHDAEPKPSSRLLVAAGFAAASAAWTKNEGLMFVAAVFLVRAIAAWRKSGVRAMLGELGPLLAGAAPVLGVVLIFKMTAKTENDILAALNWRSLAPRLTDISRVGLIVAGFSGAFWHVGKALLIILLEGFLLLRRTPTCGPPATARLAAVLTLMLGGYFCVYLLTPLDLAWHLNTSVDRLVMHLWPSLLLFVFLSVRPQSI